MNALIIGTGSVALCFSQWLNSLGHSTIMYQPFLDKKHGFMNISTCWLDIDGVITQKSEPQIFSLGPAGVRVCSSFDCILFVGTVERFQEFAETRGWNLFRGVDIILLSSWHGSLKELHERIPSNVLPAYPVIACEEWDGQLVACGSSLLEIDGSQASNEKWKIVLANLKMVGFRLNLLDMSTRFRARFSTTSFAYSYIRSLPGHEGDSVKLKFSLERGIQQLKTILGDHPDLLGDIEGFPRSLERLWTYRDTLGAVGWIVNILMNKKLGKTNYFIDRLSIGI